MKKIFLIIFLCLINFLLIEANAGIKVSPTLIELESKNARNNYITASFVVQNDNNNVIRYKVYPKYFKISNEGKMNIYDVSKEKDSLVNNIRFVPSEFTLKNNEIQKIRLTITDLKKLSDGESRLVLFLEDVKPKEINLPNNFKNVSTKILVKTRVGIPVYLDNGHVVKNCSIEEFEAYKNDKNLVCNMKILSSGNSKVRYFGKIQIIKDKKLVQENKISKNVVGRNNFLSTQEIVPISDIKEVGEYKLRLILNYRDENFKNKKLIKETNFIMENEEHSI